MIKKWEVWIETPHSIADILMSLKAKNIPADFELEEKGNGMLTIKHKDGHLIKFPIELKYKLDDVYEYELGSWKKADYDYLLSLVEGM